MVDLNLFNKDNLIIFTGPSGSGKTTLIKKLLKDFNDSFEFSISHTTRIQRESEKNGFDYYFIDESEFKQMIENKNFLEWAEVHNNFYGTTYSELGRIIKNNKKAILDIDVQGATNIKDKKINAKYIFISIPIDELKNRLIGRNSDKKDAINLRVENAKTELKKSKNWKYIVENIDLDKSYLELKKIIFDGE